MKRICFLLLTIILFFSCQTEIEVNIPTYYNKLVVEGYIENDQYPMVSLYRSVPYFSTMSLDYLLDHVVIRDAKVFVTSSKGQTQELYFISSPEAPLFFAYTTNRFMSGSFRGELNTSYTLRIEWGEKIYTSETSILETFDLDSVGFVPRFGRTEIDSVANLRIQMTDDGQSDNYYQFKVKIHCEQFQDRLWITTLPAVFDNSPFRGQTFNYEIVRGAPSTIFMPEMTERELRRYLRGNYRMGDTVYLKYARLDHGAYRFWHSANGELTFGQNPFMSPTPIISNITSSTGEKCLGVWCGLAAKEMMLILDTATTKTSGSAFRF
ncbi:MAG: DUF4249 domain-containing protein [Bacteroidetes bacterium]|nr:DUF4249 domain-containing protein [Bacteroidota bacterium]MCL2301890.1 DUF4249 domain-containing protein [Lentimicrobiaceae bacterium]